MTDHDASAPSGATNHNNNNMPYYEDDEDEDECRVCRGPAEEGRILYRPCACRGSIGLTHQDCLQSWLNVQRGNGGSCELCGTRFVFEPRYAPGAPERMPAIAVLGGLSKRAVATWLPFVIRTLLAASLWLVVAPLITGYLYHGWMDRPGVIFERFQWNLLAKDAISGAVVAACIIVSFLSLMSFADFLRVEWQHRGGFGQRRDRLRDRVREGMPEEEPAPRDEDIDNVIWDHVQAEILAQPNLGRDDRLPFGEGFRDFARAEERIQLEEWRNEEDDASDEDDDDDDHGEDSSIDTDSWYEDEEEEDEEEEGEEDEIPPLEPPGRHAGPENPGLEAPRDNEPRGDGPRNIARDALPADMPAMVRPDMRQMDFDADDQGDVDINLALDEILGIRGPLPAVIRNMMWFLAFNAIYLGFFSFMPRAVGTAVSSFVFNMTVFDKGTNMTSIMAVHNASETMSFVNILGAVQAESEKNSAVFRLNDLLAVTLGYLSCAAAMVFVQSMWSFSQKVGIFRRVATFLGIRTANPGGALEEEMREALDEMNRAMFGQGLNEPILADDPPGVAINDVIGVTLEAIMAFVKVGVLLFLKMFMLPVVLGLCLDGSVMWLLGDNLEDRIGYAGKDLFSFVLLHWVLGITFMLLVTVSVLQLREVAHPDLLSQVIRPQEPQPDLLGNLMHESVGTHAKRMLLSLGIYAVLLTMHVYVPAQVLMAYGLQKYLPFLELKFCYLMTPQLQIPLELLFFHLCMLALLEKYKNGLGELQHHWLKLMCTLTGLADCMLPRRVDCFRLIGSRPLLDGSMAVDTFWYDLARGETNREVLLRANFGRFAPTGRSLGTGAVTIGDTKPNGERVLRFGADFVRLPIRLPGRSWRSRSLLLPTKIGPFRLKREIFDVRNPVIELWAEVPGTVIPRPPEGWDDLGQGGADVQGRWAWGGERKSTIERGVAHRRPFFPKGSNFGANFIVCAKLVVVVVLSWLATTLLLFLALTTPLAFGRVVYSLFRVPEKWVHDPLAFAIGTLVAFPAFRFIARTMVTHEFSAVSRLRAWMGRFHPPSRHKVAVLLSTAWVAFLAVPLLCGWLYEVTFIRSTDWFLGKQSLFDFSIQGYATGVILLLMWAYLCMIGLLTRRFRVLLQEGRDIFEDPANARAAAWVDAGNGNLRLAWQGEHGRVTRFFLVWKAIVSDWDWEHVDEDFLLHDCAIPVVFELTRVTIYMLAGYAVCSCFPSLTGFQRAAIVRSWFALACTVHISRAWKEQLHSWFEAAHQTARDERFLVGEELINYRD